MFSLFPYFIACTLLLLSHAIGQISRPIICMVKILHQYTDRLLTKEAYRAAG